MVFGHGTITTWSLRGHGMVKAMPLKGMVTACLGTTVTRVK